MTCLLSINLFSITTVIAAITTLSSIEALEESNLGPTNASHAQPLTSSPSSSSSSSSLSSQTLSNAIDDARNVVPGSSQQQLSSPSSTSSVAINQWSKSQPSKVSTGLINYFQFAQPPSYNYRQPFPSHQSSSSFSSLMSNLLSPFNKVMSRRAAGNKLFSLADQFNPKNLANFQAMKNFQDGGGQYSIGNIDALNEAVQNVMVGLNGLQPGQASQLAGQLGNYLSMVSSASSVVNQQGNKQGKKLFEIPKHWYKLLGDKLSGASEAAYMATVPLKDSFMHTLKSFYSYIKPSRSQTESPFGDPSQLLSSVASVASSSPSSAASFAQDSTKLSKSITSKSTNQGMNQNPKRRQSLDSYSTGYYSNTKPNSPSSSANIHLQLSSSSSMLQPQQSVTNTGIRKQHHQHGNAKSTIISTSTN
ncbi:hypothetical protein QR98_0094550 [Sarcoptes scabiei]|uniref:Uncharacterized protein n=1 Tax=Sarcoptes scabiei TaxID=52283 RepID=A0A132AKD6_SARSC|nr:hypothetical protein QR98_0094550 [Sarcoptes scabiei]